MKMDWRLNNAEANALDVHGVGAFLKRLQEATATDGKPLEGFRFLQDAKEMLRFTREIERELLESGANGPLYVGFQNVDKLEKETSRYRNLKAAGVVVYGFGEGEPPQEWSEGLERWRRLGADRTALVNQWFFISMTPAPVAFVGWEVSDDDLWGKGGVSSAGKVFSGFVSEDERVVGAVIEHLKDVMHDRAPGGSTVVGPVGDLIKHANTRRIIALTDAGKRPFLKRALADVSRVCAETGAELFLYDLSAASYLVSPYPDEDDRWKSPQSVAALRRTLGRSGLADTVEAASATGATVKGILPFKVGFGHLLEWCASETIDTIVMPVEFSQPSLFERLQGLSLQALTERSAGITIIVDDPARGPWVVAAGEVTSEAGATA